MFTGITLQMKRISLSIRKDPSKEWYEYETELYEKYNGIIIRRNTQFKEYYNLFLNNIEDYEKYALPLLKESWKFILNTES